MQDSGKRIESLRQRAGDLLNVLHRQARRAFVLEITGTPKAGKTTSVNALKGFFKKCGFRVEVLKERAAECPLPMKGHFFFNTWTTCTMMAGVLATVDTDVDLVIVDRGFFDALVWLELQHGRAQLSGEEKSAFSQFVTLDRWRALVDATVVMAVPPDIALKRENLNAIIPHQGSVMNSAALNDFNNALATVREEYESRFNLINFDASEDNIVETNVALLEELLPYIESWADPEVAVLDRELVFEHLGSAKSVFGHHSQEVLSQLERSVKFSKRSTVEENSQLVQVVACGVPMNSQGVFVFKRSSRDNKVTTYGRHLLWKGCHVSASTEGFTEAARASLVERIRSDLHLARVAEPQLLGIVWSSEDEDKHLAIFYRIDIESSDVARSMKDKEFRRSRQHTMTGTFQDRQALQQAEGLELEPWSRELLKHLED